MAFLSFDHGAVLYGSTPVENMFLMEYLPSAPDDCLRVYLYARLLCAYPEQDAAEAGVADVARALRLTDEAVEEAKAQGIHGKETTPFLLAKIKDLTGGDSLASNIQLVYNNARLAAATAVELSKLAKN